MNELESRLRALAALLPEPGPELTARARDAARAAVRDRSSRLARRLSRRRGGLVVALACLVLAGGALAVTRWTEADVPAAGRGANAFVLPSEDLLPGGYARRRPPRLVDLPPRPSLVFPAGVSYAGAVADYHAARQRGEVVPPGARLEDPLPAGKVVWARDDGRVALDPAAPVGYDLWTGLVGGLAVAPSSSFAVPLARCQVILPGAAPAPAHCRGIPREAPFVRERPDGTWAAAANQAGALPTKLVGTTDLAVLARPATGADRLPDHSADGLQPPPGRAAPDLAGARLAREEDGVRYFVVPGADETVCLAAVGPGGGGATCNPRSVLVTFGAIPLYTARSGGRRTAAGLVGDGFDLVTAPDGTSAPILGNVFAIDARSGDTLTLSGPAGRHRVSVF